jgi:hypothetical protein
MQQPLFLSQQQKQRRRGCKCGWLLGAGSSLLACLAFSARNTKQFVDSFFKAEKVFYSSWKGNALNFQRPLCADFSDKRRRRLIFHLCVKNEIKKEEHVGWPHTLTHDIALPGGITI